MNDDLSVQQTDVTALATLFGVGSDGAAERLPWTDADRGPMLRHQLDQPYGETGLTYRQLLLADDTPAPVLREIKDEAKRHLDDEAALPGDVATVLYYAALAAGRRAGASITKLTDVALASGWDWCLGQDWVEDKLQAVFRAARDTTV